MNVLVTTLYHANYQALAEVVLPNWKAYCDKHDYDLITYRGEFGNIPNWPIGFQKVAFVYNALYAKENDWDVALVLDLDILITNMNRKVEEFIDDTHDYFVTTGFNGLCNGAFMVKKSKGGREILEYMLENKYGKSNEQDTLKHCLGEPVLKGRLKLFPYNTFNSMMLDLYPEHGAATRERGDWREGDFLLHLPALSLERRIEIFSNLLVQ